MASNIARASKVDGWIRCSYCGHKLGRIVRKGFSSPPTSIEIKCHSCKTINVWTADSK